MRRQEDVVSASVESRRERPANVRPSADGRRLRGIVELGAMAHSGSPTQATMDRAVELVSELLDVEYAKILELMPGGTEVKLVAGVGWKEGLVGNARVSTGLDSQAGYTLASEHPVVVDDLRAESRFSGPTLLHDHGVVSGISVIIPGDGGRPWGVFGAHTKERRSFGEEDVLFLQAVTNTVAAALAAARSSATLRDTKSVLEREVAERTRDLRSAVEDLEAFNVMVAHDLRGPLRGSEQLARALVEDYQESLDDEGRRLLTILGDTTTRMRNLVDDLLTLAKAGRDPLVMEDVDVTALVRERWKALADREDGRPLEFSVEEGLTARADRRLLGIALDNLLGNALKFTRHVPRPSIEVGSLHLDVGGTAFYVRDNGAGFAPDRAPELFHAFRRLHSPSEFEGTGVGLATVRRIVERHNGRVWAESPGPGEGATLFLRLLPAGLP